MLAQFVITFLFSHYVTAANAGASSQTFNQGGGGFGNPYGGGFSGSASNAAASSQSFNQVCILISKVPK